MFFSKTVSTIFLVFGLNLVLNMIFNLHKIYFSEKICNLEIFNLKIVQTITKLKFLVIFSTLHHQFSLILHIMIGGHDGCFLTIPLCLIRIFLTICLKQPLVNLRHWHLGIWHSNINVVCQIVIISPIIKSQFYMFLSSTYFSVKFQPIDWRLATSLDKE